jgi:hypothetical protein
VPRALRMVHVLNYQHSQSDRGGLAALRAHGDTTTRSEPLGGAQLP